MADNKFALKVMCPDRTFFEGEADMVEMNTTEGYIGVYPGTYTDSNCTCSGNTSDS